MKPSWTLLKFLLHRHPYRAAGVLLIALAVIFASVGLLSTSAWLITFCALTPMVAEILVPVVYVRLFGLLRGLLRYAERLISHETTFRLLGDLRVALYRVIALKPPITAMRLDQGDAFGRLVDDIERLQDFYLRTFNPAITAVLTALFGYALIAAWGTAEALAYLFIYTATLLFLPLLIYSLTAGLSRLLARQLTQLRRFVFELLSGLKDLQSTGALIRQTDKLENQLQDIESNEQRLAASRAFSSFWLALAAPAAGVVSAWLAGQRVLSHELNPLFMPVLIFAVMALFEALQPLPMILQKLEQSRLAAHRVLELVGDDPLELSKSPIRLKSPNPCSDLGSYTLLLQKVSCRYPEMPHSLLNDLSFRLDKGRKIAVVGASGSGKTTLVYLLAGWLQPDCGTKAIYAEGSNRNLADLANSLSTDMEYFSVVNQDVYLFNTTLRNNLRIGRSTGSDAELITALEQAQLKEWFSHLPLGLDTEMGEGDGLLSGGQRQRIGIARALLRQTPFLILDEATAGIDAITELQLMQRLLNEQAPQRSGFLTVTHRLVAMEAYDEIIVLKDGKIDQRGRHAELLLTDGLYRRMWQLQTE